MATDVCAAHQILYDTVTHLRENQVQLYDLGRESSDRAAETAINVATLKATTEAGFKALHDRQDNADKRQAEGFERLAKIMAANNRSRWTPKMIVSLAVALIGPTGLSAYAIFFMGPK